MNARRQEAAISRQREAREQADRIIDEAIAKVRASRPADRYTIRRSAPEEISERVVLGFDGAATGGDFVLAVQRPDGTVHLVDAAAAQRRDLRRRGIDVVPGEVV